MIGMQAAPLPFHPSIPQTHPHFPFLIQLGAGHINSTFPSLQAPSIFLNHFVSTPTALFGREGEQHLPRHRKGSYHQGATPDPTAPLPLPQPSAQMGWKEVGLCVIFEPMPSKPWGCIYHSSGVEAVFRVWGAWQWSWSNLLNPLHQSLCNYSTKVYQPQVDPTMLGGKHASWQQSPKSSWENFSGKICLFVSMTVISVGVKWLFQLQCTLLIHSINICGKSTMCQAHCQTLGYNSEPEKKMRCFSLGNL